MNSCSGSRRQRPLRASTGSAWGATPSTSAAPRRREDGSGILVLLGSLIDQVQELLQRLAMALNGLRVLQLQHLLQSIEQPAQVFALARRQLLVDALGAAQQEAIGGLLARVGLELLQFVHGLGDLGRAQPTSVAG